MLARVACLACQRAEHTVRDMRTISVMPVKLCFLNYSQTSDSYNIRVLFAMDSACQVKEDLLSFYQHFYLIFI